MSNWWGRVTYLLCVGAFVVLACELMLRVFASDPEYYWNYRFSFVSPAAFQNRGDGLWTYRPHVAVREVAVYAVASLFSSKPRFVVESDCQMRSNNLGLLQDADIAPGTNATVIVGDSFAAGQGGCPWFDRLQSRRSSDRLVNGGLMGTGVEQWRRLVIHLQQTGVKVERLLVIAISNDFKREAWNWSQSQLACLDHGACPPDNESGLWLPLASGESNPELIERAARRFSERFADAGPFYHLRMFLKQHSYLYKFIDRAASTVKAMIKGSGPRAAGIRLENEAALDSFKALGIPLHVLVILQRDEVGLWGDNADTVAALAVLDAHSVTHSRCRLAQGDFLPNDGHPNRAGYDKVAVCAHDVLDRMARSVAPTL
jgi:hypothetical protein